MATTNYIFLNQQHGLVTNGDAYVRSVQLGVKRAWLRGFVTISSCTDMTDYMVNPPLVTYKFYTQSSRGSTWGDWRFLHREAVTCNEWDNDGTFMCQYTPLTDFIMFDLESASYDLHYSINGFTTRQHIKHTWILQADDISEA